MSFRRHLEVRWPGAPNWSARCEIVPPVSEAAAVAVLIGAFVLPLLHVMVSPRGGPFTPPPGSGCPLGPRVGWLVLVLLLGPVGWLLYLVRRRPANDPR